MAVPSIAIFVRHAANCPYRSDEAFKRCQCRKHVRWFKDGRQIKKSAGTRSWTVAEEFRRKLEEQFRAGKTPTATDDRKTISRAIELFMLEKRTDGKCSAGVLNKYERELGRFQEFVESRGKYFPGDIDKEMLLKYRATWESLYPSSATRQQVQARLRGFLRFCYDDRMMDKLPKLSAIEVDEPPTLPLSAEQYAVLLDTVGKQFAESPKATKVRALIQLMRHSALAIRDAVTLKRDAVAYDAKKKFHRVATSRQKTGTFVSVPLPPEIAKEITAVMNDSPKYFFWNGKGKETSAVTNWQHDLRTVFRAAFGEDTDFTPHCLRDTAAVEWLSAGIPLEEVSKLLGHSSVKTTEKSYSPWVTVRQDRLDSLVVGTWK